MDHPNNNQTQSNGNNLTNSLGNSLNFTAALNIAVLPYICLITLSFSIIHLLLALLNILFSLPPGKVFIVISALTSGLIILFCYFLLKFKILPLNLLPVVTAFVIGITLGNSFIDMWVCQNIIYTTNILLVIITLGSFLLSASWILILIAVSWLGWGSIIVLIANDMEQVLYFGIALFLASVFATIMHHLHYHLFKDLILLRADVNKQNNHLQNMVKNMTQSQERFRRLANASFEGIVIHDQGKILDANKSFSKLFNVEISNIIGGNLIDFFAAQSVSTTQTKLQENSSKTFEAFGKATDNALFPMEVMTYNLPHEGRILQVASLKDITQRKENEAKLVAYQERLEQTNTELAKANKLKGAFLTNMSHELRTPLTAITGYAEVLVNQDFGALNKDQALYAQNIYDSGMQLVALINRIFDLSKLEADKLTLYLQKIYINELINDSLVIIRAQADAKGIVLEAVNHTSFELFVDPIRIKQVLYNYLSNAVKFTPQGGSVKIVAQDISDGIQVEVIDTGIGIDEQYIPQLFQPFFQIDNNINRNYEGAGLGLSLSKHLIELHGGKVWVTSQKDQGSTFSFWLPKALNLTAV